MPTNAQITNRILRGQLLQNYLVKTYSAQEKVGNILNNWDLSVYVSKLIEGLQTQNRIADYVSATTLLIYNKLGSILGQRFIDGASYDPNAQMAGYVINNTITGTIVNSGKIPFSNVHPVQLLNYNTTYKRIYGNNPILQIFVTGYTQDEQTPPTITYATPNDPSTDIISVTWDYPVNVSGYISITGIPA